MKFQSSADMLLKALKKVPKTQFYIVYAQWRKRFRCGRFTYAHMRYIHTYVTEANAAIIYINTTM